MNKSPFLPYRSALLYASLRLLSISQGDLRFPQVSLFYPGLFVKHFIPSQPN